MRKHLWFLTVVALLGLATSAEAADLNVRKHYWEDRLSRELPAGSDFSTAQKFFGAAHLEQHYHQKDSTLIAVERNVSHSLLVSCDILIDCKFDAQALLQRCIVEPVCTGP
jgi:hypothetical protein